MWWKKVSSTLLVPAVIIGLSLCMSSVASAAAVAVVNGGGQASISKKTLKKILLGKEKKWDDVWVLRSALHFNLPQIRRMWVVVFDSLQ